MSNLTFSDKRKLEKLFNMQSGYVLNFSNRLFKNFIGEHTGYDIYNERYSINGDSKANRLRCFWDIENNYNVGRLINALIDYGKNENCLCGDDELVINCINISTRLVQDSPVSELEIFSTDYHGNDFEKISQEIRSSIEKNQPEVGIDRLHTFVIKYVRKLCEQLGIDISRDKALHSLFGELVKKLNQYNYVESEMSIRLLKTGISILESFNDVRNNKSLAHDNNILSYEESLFIFNYITSLIKFLKSIEVKINNKKDIQNFNEIDIPF